ncbi:MAG: hypothetical protein KAT38_07120 [Bacteroidales bacterium]|jgi:hypothetical protein|nr:hypothetical protein [Bacteroidales bacterium]
MKRLLIILFVFIIICSFSKIASAQDPSELVGKCVFDIGNNTTYLKDYVVKLPEASSQYNIPIHKNTAILLKNSHYRLTVCNSDDSEGQGIIQLYNNGKKVGSSIAPSGKIYSSFDFPCKKTGSYQIWISFKDGKEGFAVGILSLVND